MERLVKLFGGRKPRAVWDPKMKTWLYSVVDVIAALRSTDYDTARNYWKQVKFRMSKDARVFKSLQIKLPAKDGKLRYSDVMTYKEIVCLIQKLNLSGKVATVFKKLIGFIAADSETMFKVCGTPPERGQIPELVVKRLQTRRVRPIS
ncbi:MAG: hypothetical protein FWF77_10555 [Defluviitaleaceae bacterium]|nr:hypothetical protein [Defluviitaleaceae bacterium]